MNRAWSIVSGAGLVFMLSGCAVGPDYTPPETAMPSAYAEPLAGGPTAEAPASATLARWWTTLNDPELDALVERAVSGNLDLREAAARIREARAQRGIIAGEALPSVDAAGAYSRSRQRADRGGPRAGDFDDSGDLYTAGFDVAWEIDVFGRVSRGVEAADADIAAAVETRRDVLVSLLAEVARNHVELRSLHERVRIARENTQVQREAVALAEARASAGLTSRLDVERALAQLASTEATIPGFEARIRQTRNRIAVLLGAQPGSLDLPSIDGVPPPPPGVPVGLPSDLLRRRPDIRRAERELAASSARIGEATADLFPRFSLTGDFGVSSTQFGDLADSDSRFWSIGPAVRWPIFQGGRIRANIEVQNARQERAAVAYERSVLTALEETENALASYGREQESFRSLAAAVEADQRAVALANELYSKGLSDFSAVIDAQRQLFINQDRLAQSRRDVTSNFIALYKALGGGWEVDPLAPTASAARAGG